MADATRRRLTAAQRRLAARHWKDARKIAGAFSRRCPGLPIDWDSVAAEALCRAAATWRKGRGTAFPSWLYHKVVGACRDEARALGLRGYRTTGGDRPLVVSLDGLCDEDGEPITLPADELPVGWELESEDAVLGLLARLPTSHQRVMRPLCLDAGSLRTEDAGRKLGLDGSTVRSYRQMATEKLREVLRG